MNEDFRKALRSLGLDDKRTIYALRKSTADQNVNIQKGEVSAAQGRKQADIAEEAYNQMSSGMVFDAARAEGSSRQAAGG